MVSTLKPLHHREDKMLAGQQDSSINGKSKNLLQGEKWCPLKGGTCKAQFILDLFIMSWRVFLLTITILEFQAMSIDKLLWKTFDNISVAFFL